MSPRTLTRIIFARLIFAWINFHGFPGIFELLSTKMNPHEIFAQKKKKNQIRLNFTFGLKSQIILSSLFVIHFF